MDINKMDTNKKLTDAYTQIALSQIKKDRLKANLKENLETERRISIRQSGYKLYLAKAATAAGLLLALSCIGMTAHASYTIYQNTHLRVFFERNIDKEQIDEIGEEIRQIDGVAVCRFVGSDEAWESFQSEYLTPELSAAFEENPLIDSYNYEIRIALDADAWQIKEALSGIEGVRQVSGFWEE